MALLNIVYHPDQRLKLVAQPVSAVNDDIRKIVADMLETMYHHDGVGLASTQVAVKHRIFVMDCAQHDKEPRIFINPVISDPKDPEIKREGCISFPGVAVDVERAKTITITYLDLEGHTQTESLDGLWAHCAQHENDHLDGITMLDHISPLKRDRASKKVLKFLKEMGKDTA